MPPAHCTPQRCELCEPHPSDGGVIDRMIRRGRDPLPALRDGVGHGRHLEITDGPDDRLWFTDGFFLGNTIGAIRPPSE